MGGRTEERKERCKGKKTEERNRLSHVLSVMRNEIKKHIMWRLVLVVGYSSK